MSNTFKHETKIIIGPNPPLLTPLSIIFWARNLP